MSKQIFTIFFLVGLLVSKTAKTQDASIFFNVNMTYQIELGIFDPTSEFVDIAGDFNGWGTDLTVLSDDDQDSIYSIVLSGFTVQQIIQFKFRQNGVWDGTEEFPGGGPNRVHTVSSEFDSLYFWYSDLVSPTGPPLAGFSSSATNIKTGSFVSFQNLSSGNVEFREWSFEGGIPDTSTQQNPRVFYNTPGSFDVQLIVGNTTQSDTLLIADYITVTERDTSQLDWWNNTIFYEIFVRSFYDSDGDGIGDLIGLTEKLDYLNDGDPSTNEDLGITGIWLMPINPSPSYHGYDVADYQAINPDYGTMDDFVNFLNAAHQRGIKVIIDYVMNHSSSQHPWFIDSQNNANGKRNYYRWLLEDPGYVGPWGQTVWHYHSSGYYYGLFWGGMPDLNYEEPEVTESMFEFADFWLDDIGIDGFRLDAVKFIYEDGPILEDLPETFQFWKDFSAHTKESAPHSVVVGEAWTNTETVVNYVEDDGLDFCFEFDLAGQLLNTANHGDATDLRYQMSLVYGIYPHQQWAPFLTNHDMNRVMNVLGQSDEKNKLAAALYLTLPGVPFIYYGEEIGMLGEKPDENIRRPMQWSNTYQGGFTTGIPWNNLNYNYPEYNVETELADPNSILNRYKKLIDIRNLKRSLQTGDYLEAWSTHNEIFSFIRAAENDTAIVVINTSDQAITDAKVDMLFSGLSAGSYTWWEMMQNQTELLTIDASGHLIIPAMQAYEVKIWSYDEVSGLPFTSHEDQFITRVFPNPAHEYISLFSEKNQATHFNIAIYNLHGVQLGPVRKLVTGQYHQIPIDHLPPGFYMLIFEIEGIRQGVRIVKN